MKLLLKVYFWIYILIVIFSTILLPIEGTAVDYIWLITIIVTLIGFKRYLFVSKSGDTLLWKIMFAASLIYYVAFVVYLDRKFGGFPPESYADYLLTVIPALPAFIGTLLYIKRPKISE